MDETLSENDFRYIIGREIQKLLWLYAQNTAANQSNQLVQKW